MFFVSQPWFLKLVSYSRMREGLCKIDNFGVARTSIGHF